jgi:uncharacterized protein YdgA (DUF945 family)
MKKLFVFFVFVVILVAGLAPWVVGMQAEQSYEDIITRLEEQGMVVRNRDYDRGWLASSAEAELLITLGGSGSGTDVDTVEVSLRNRIEHGPLLLGALREGRIEPLQALIHTQLIVDDQPLFPPEYPLMLETRIPLQGDAHTLVELPPYQKAASQGVPGVAFEGVRGEAFFDPAFERVRAALVMPRLEADDGVGGGVTITNLQIDTDARSGPSGLMLGEGRFDVGTVTIKASDPALGVTLEGLDMRVRSEAEGQNVNLGASYAFERLRMDDGTVYGPAQLGIRVAGLPAAVLARIQEKLRALRDPGLTEEERMAGFNDVLAADGAQLLAGNPEFRLDPLQVNTPDGLIEGSFLAKLDGVRGEDFQQPQRLLDKTTAQARLRLPEVLLQGVIRDWARRQFEAIASSTRPEGVAEDEATPALDPQELDRQAETMAQQQLEALVQQQLVVRQGDAIVTVARYGGGLLTVNGKTVALPDAVSR